jgi:hypothetical protein
VELDRLLSALDPAAPPSLALASALSDEALRRKWERTSQHIVKAAQDKVSLEGTGQAALEALHRTIRDDPAPG